MIKNVFPCKPIDILCGLIDLSTFIVFVAHRDREPTTGNKH